MTTTFITGGGGDIGRALATRFARRGDHVIVADRVLAAARSVATSIGSRATAVELDVTDAEAVDQAIAGCCSQLGRIDVLVNNAGLGVAGRVEDLTLAQWYATFDVNVLGVVHTMHAAYPRMIAAGGGHIVNIASLAGLVPTPLLAPYSASKHAVVGLSLAWRVEAARHGVVVQAFCPGPVDTQMLDNREPPYAPGGGKSVDVRGYLTAAAGPAMTPAALADVVVRSMRRGKAVVVVPRRSSGVVRAQRFLPRLTSRLVSRNALRFTPTE